MARTKRIIANKCRWEADEDGVYHTDCGEDFVFIDSGPKENHIQFCCYCGKPCKAEPSADMNPREKGDDDGVEYADPGDHLKGID